VTGVQTCALPIYKLPHMRCQYQKAQLNRLCSYCLLTVQVQDFELKKSLLRSDSEAADLQQISEDGGNVL